MWQKLTSLPRLHWSLNPFFLNTGFFWSESWLGEYIWPGLVVKSKWTKCKTTHASAIQKTKPSNLDLVVLCRSIAKSTTDSNWFTLFDKDRGRHLMGPLVKEDVFSMMIIKFLGLSLFALHWWTREAVCRWDHANKDHLMWRHASTIHLKSVNHQNTNPNKSLFFTPIPLLGTNGPLLSYPATLHCRRTRPRFDFRSH